MAELTAPTIQTNLLDFNRADMAAYLKSLGEAPYRATQLLQWLHQRGVSELSEMTNLSKTLRACLQEQATIQAPEVVLRQDSDDGTCKWLLRLADGNCIETVFIPEDDRGTLCVSSQVGCALNCSFCSTAQQGFSRNLSVAEIIGQVWIAVRHLSNDQKIHDRHVTNVVMMGMGEPLLNFENVVKAMDLMMDDFAYGLSKRRVTLSTSGVVPTMLELKQASAVSLAVSLHAPNDELRNVLVPINKKYPIKELMAVCKNYFAAEGRRVVTFEYVMLDGINDTDLHAKQLIQILAGVPCKVNLIPFNPFPQTQYRRSTPQAIERFRNRLMGAGINTITRKTRGDDIDAACGQLVGEVQDRTRRKERLQRRVIPIIAAPREGHHAASGSL